MENNLRLVLLMSMIIIAAALNGCIENSIYKNELILIDGKYRSIRNKLNPFTGKVITKYQSGEIESKVELKDGFPLGSGYHYGYVNDIIVEEVYHRCTYNHSKDLNHWLLRINKLEVIEGKKTIYEVFKIICKEKLKITEEKHEEILTLIKSCVNDKGSAEKIKIEYLIGEFESPFEIKYLK